MSSLASKISVLIIDDTQSHSDQLTQLLSREDDLYVTVAPEDVAEAIRLTRKEQPDVVLLSVQREEPLDIIRRLDTASPGTAIIVLLVNDQQSLTRDVLLAGARAYLTHIYDRSDLVETIYRIHEVERRRRNLISRSGMAPAPEIGRIIGVHGAKGGVGATTIAVNLAVALRGMTGARVALVDGNLYSGDIAVSLNIISRTSITDLLPHLRDLDKELLDRACIIHRSGVSVLLGPDDLEQAESVTGEAMQRILKSMRPHFDYVVVDTCSLPDQVTTASLDIADSIVLISTPELPSLKNAARFLRLSRDYGYASEKLLLVINRENSRGAIARPDIEENLKLKVAVGIRSDGQVMINAINAGEPAVSLDGRSRLSRGIRQLVHAITTGPAPAELSKNGHQPGTSRGPLGWLRR